jgi:excisionase family DNA binding protein
MPSKPDDNPEFLTLDGAARLVGCTHWSIRRWIRLGRLTRYQSGSRIYIRRDELLKLVLPKKAKD